MKHTQLIAEIGQAHDGSLGILHSYIDALAEQGVDAIKFQLHIAQAESSPWEPFRTKFSYQDASRFDYWKRMELSFEQWLGIKKHCEEKKLEFLASPFSIAAVKLLEQLEVKRYKIGSGEVNNSLMLEIISKTGKPVLLSSGMSKQVELDHAVETIRKHHQHMTIMQCTTAYPSEPEQWGLAEIGEIKQRYQLPVGFSDHSGTIHAGVAACALGAEVIEVHSVFDRRMFGPDSKASLTVDEIGELRQALNLLDRSANSHFSKESDEIFSELKIMFGKSLAVNKDLQSGHVVCLEDLETKKPMGHGIPASDFKMLLGKKLISDIQAFEFINWTDVE